MVQQVQNQWTRQARLVELLQAENKALRNEILRTMQDQATKGTDFGLGFLTGAALWGVVGLAIFFILR